MTTTRPNTPVASSAAETGTAATRPSVRYSPLCTTVVFILSAVIAGGTVAGPGLSWDEPAYRHSQVTLQSWLRELKNASSVDDAAGLFSKDSLLHFWEYNRFGHNFHPPLAGLLNLATFGLMGSVWDDVSARRLASALEFAGAVALLTHFLGRRLGTMTGVFAGMTLLTMPRVMGDAHVIGTDMPLMFFWAATALSFYRALDSRRWQWLFAVCWGLLFLVKFTGVVIAAPLGLWWLFDVRRRQPARAWRSWLGWSLALVLPLLPLAFVLLLGGAPASSRSAAADWARWGLERQGVLQWLFLWPMILLIGYYTRRSRAGLSVAMELPWVVLACTPLVCLVLDPTWWHDPVEELARYFDLNLRREGHLPDIGIFYLGKRYLYSLPWHNAWVLMAVTIPFGALLFGLIATGRTLIGSVPRLRSSVADAGVAQDAPERIGGFFLLQAVTLPLFRMLPTPAHDGVRLFLPTFFFWAGLAALGARWLVLRFGGPSVPKGVVWVGLFLVGPVWAGVEWVRIHPFELSYYNVGLARAMDWGFEPTYWYDAVTPRTLDDFNHRLPNGIKIGFPDPLINPEVFIQLQALGRLRSDIAFDTAHVQGFPWYWLLTHSSKATSFTRLLYACQPWYESGHDGVRLFSVVDPHAAAVAWALRALTVTRDESNKLGPLVLHDAVFSADAATLHRAVAILDEARKSDKVPESLSGEPPVVRQLVQDWMKGGQVDPNIAMVLERDPKAMDQAILILTSRPSDVRKVLQYPGYLRPEQFGGYFPIARPGA